MYLGREWTVDHDQRVRVSNAELKYAVLGSGEPVVCIHGTSNPDGLITPLKFYAPLFEDYQMISYYRAGYNGSTLPQGNLSIEGGAQHIRELLDHLGIAKAHIVAFSLGGIIGFQFMLDYPERAHSVTLLEPYLPREEPEAIQANINAYMGAMKFFEAGDKLGAAQAYMEAICGPSFLSAVDMTCPLDVWERAGRCADVTFTVDFPAVMNWGFVPSKADQLVARKPQMPVLAVLGIDSESILPGFRATQRFLMEWLPQAERAAIMNATHGLQMMNPVAVGEAIYQFLKKHPMI